MDFQIVLNPAGASGKARITWEEIEPVFKAHAVYGLSAVDKVVRRVNVRAVVSAHTYLRKIVKVALAYLLHLIAARLRVAGEHVAAEYFLRYVDYHKNTPLRFY